MQVMLPYLVIAWRYISLYGQMLISMFVGNVRLAFASFDPKDDRLYKSDFRDAREFLSERNDGFCLTGTESVSRKDSATGVLVTGAIGSGKGTVVVVNTIIRLAGTCVLIVNDPSSETTNCTSGYGATKSRVVRYDWLNPENSDGFNPLDWAKNKSALYKIVSILAYATQGSETKEPFWVLQCINVLYAFSAIALKLEPEYRNFVNVKHLISQFMSNPDKIDPLFIKHGDKELIELYQSINAMSENTQKSVLATALSSLSLWNDENVARITAKSSFRFEDIRREPVIIYVNNATVNAKLYAPLIEIFYETLMGELFAQLPQKDDLDVFFLFDEASTMPLKNSMNSYLNNSRKFRLNFLLAFQSQQIESIYGSEASSIKSALRTKVWIGSGAGLETSNELESLLGKTEVSDASGKKSVRPLMLAQDIRAMKNECIIISPEGNAYKTAVTPYFKQPFIERKTKIPPVQILNPSMPITVPLIPLYAPPKTK